jgi:hypothetical protein
MIHKVIANSVVTAPFAIALTTVRERPVVCLPVQGHLNLLYCPGVRLRYVPPLPTSITHSSTCQTSGSTSRSCPRSIDLRA